MEDRGTGMPVTNRPAQSVLWLQSEGVGFRSPRCSLKKMFYVLIPYSLVGEIEIKPRVTYPRKNLGHTPLATGYLLRGWQAISLPLRFFQPDGDEIGIGNLSPGAAGSPGLLLCDEAHPSV